MESKIRVIAGFFIRSLYALLFLNRRDWSARLVLRYALLQIPGIALLVVILIVIQQWFELPARFTWGLVIIWVVKDVALFPLVWRAYDWDHAGDANSMVGLQGFVQERLSPSGSVRVRGELWQARVMRDGLPIEKGEVILVREIHGLTLFVEPNRKESETIDIPQKLEAISDRKVDYIQVLNPSSGQEEAILHQPSCGTYSVCSWIHSFCQFTMVDTC